MLRKLRRLATGLYHTLIPQSVRNRIDPYKAQWGMDKKLETLCPELCKASTFYVEAGANDGIRQSNTFFLEQKYGASGLLVEPAPSSFERLLRNRGENNICECCALVPKDFEGKFVEMRYSNLMSTAELGEDSDLGKSADEHALEGQQFLPSHLKPYTFGAVAATLSELFSRHRIDRVDLLCLDVEGNELAALKGVDFEAVAIKYILVESRDVNRMKEYLSKFGYSLKERMSHRDYLFVSASR